eukprot:TRINITY_DN4217_c0_g1_i1.p1 TRINITY_DN4217_c0_g1~~TRINITY_DN4217_c0_g1_i1.p1  ORF type:complete len:460 (-),score=127.88 TRINITY_DN4217_c0_g1_i1:18-1397(-)
MKLVKCSVVLFLSLIVLSGATRNIGIIGGGMGGTASAYYANLLLDDVDVTVFEKGRVGGRSMVTQFAGLDIEYGGTVYHSANRLFAELSSQFGLENVSLSGGGDMGVFDGKEFLFKESSYFPVTAFKFLWRYGLAMFKVQEIAGKIVEQWKAQYSNEIVWETVDDFIRVMDFSFLTQNSARDILINAGVQERFVDEIIAGVSRVTYNQNSSDINGLGGLISVVGSGKDLYVLKDGNFRLAEELLKHSGARLEPTTVTKVEKISEEGKTQYKVTSGNGVSLFDILIIASPLENNNVEFEFELPENSVGVRQYRRVHVTFVKGVFNPDYFGVDSVDDIPKDVVTSANSISAFTSIGTKETVGDERVVKFFSIQELTDTELNKIFVSIKDKVRYQWDAYPFLKPNPVYPPIKLNENLYYVNAFESALSVMEGELCAARNIIRLISGKKSTEGTVLDLMKEDL